MFKVEVGKGPLMFMSYARIMEEITKEKNLEELKDVFYAILYDFGTPIGCGRMRIEGDLYTIDNIKIFDKFHTERLYSDIHTQLEKKAKLLGLKEKKQ